MKKIILSFLAIISCNTYAYYQNPLFSTCSLQYRKDSFGIGMESVFKESAPPKNTLLFDSACFQLGQQWAKLMINQTGDFSSCQRDFQDAYERGLGFDYPVTQTGCFNAGFDAGIARLHYSSREQDSSRVSKSCLKYYDRGLNDGCSLRVPTLPSDRLLSECYVTGWNDGDQFKDIIGVNGEHISTGVCKH